MTCGIIIIDIQSLLSQPKVVKVGGQYLVQSDDFLFRGSCSVTTQPTRGNESGGQYLGSKSDWFLLFNITCKFKATNLFINRL